MQGLFKNVPVSLAGKNVFIDTEVVDAQLYYNIILGCIYMYVMKAVAYTIFYLIMFPH